MLGAFLGVAFNFQRKREAVKVPGGGFQHPLAIEGQLGRAGLEERLRRAIDRRDAHAVRDELIADQVVAGLAAVVELLAQLLQLALDVLLLDEVLARLVVNLVLERLRLGEFLRAVAALLRDLAAEVALHRQLRFRVGTDQPEHKEQRHHRRDEVGVRDFPAAAVMSAFMSAFGHVVVSN